MYFPKVNVISWRKSNLFLGSDTSRTWAHDATVTQFVLFRELYFLKYFSQRKLSNMSYITAGTCWTTYLPMFLFYSNVMEKSNLTVKEVMRVIIFKITEFLVLVRGKCESFVCGCMCLLLCMMAISAWFCQHSRTATIKWEMPMNSPGPKAVERTVSS